MKRNLLIFVSTLVGAFLFLLVFYLFDVVIVFSNMLKVGPWGLGVFLINVFFILLVGAFSWQIILRAYGYSLPFKDVLLIKTIGFAVSYLTPSMYVGGEPIRIYLLGKKHRISMTRIGATVVVDKFLELGAGLFYIFLGSIFTLVYYDLPPQLFVMLVVINTVFVGAMILLLISFIYKTRPFSPLIGALGKIRPLQKPVNFVMPTIFKLEGEIFSAFDKYGKSTLKAFLLNLFIGGLIFVKPFIFFYFLDFILNLPQLALLFALTHLILALQFTPGALGIFEWGEVGIFGLIGIASEKALAYSLMVRIADLLVVVGASIAGVHMGVKHFWGKRRDENMCSV